MTEERETIAGPGRREGVRPGTSRTKKMMASPTIHRLRGPILFLRRPLGLMAD